MKVHLFEHSEPIDRWGTEDRVALCGRLIPQAERCFMVNKLVLPVDVTDEAFYRQVCLDCLTEEGRDLDKHYLSAILSKEDAQRFGEKQQAELAGVA